MIHAEATTQLAQPVEKAFIIADDFVQAPAWIESCVAITQTSPGPRVAGAPLHYTYNQGGRRGEMNGEVLAYESGRLLEMKYADRMFEVTVTLRFAPTNGGSLATHSITIAPKTIFSRLMSPVIRRANRRQVANNLSRLKSLIEKTA